MSSSYGDNDSREDKIAETQIIMNKARISSNRVS